MRSILPGEVFIDNPSKYDAFKPGDRLQLRWTYETINGESLENTQEGIFVSRFSNFIVVAATHLNPKCPTGCLSVWMDSANIKKAD